MGVFLTPIIVRQQFLLSDLRGKRLAVDGNGELYQFLALIRLRDGSPLMDSRGRITSHLSGLFYRTTRLISDYGALLVFVFDGRPPHLKQSEIARRRMVRERYEAERAAAIESGDLAKAWSKATMTSRLSRDMVDEARRLLELMGLPVLLAPGEAEAQASHMARAGTVWAAASKDYDCLLFGTPRLQRFLTITGREFLPSKGVFRAIAPELIETDFMLHEYGITREQLVDLAILVGTDFNEGVRGIGPKKALKLVQEYGLIENMPAAIRDSVVWPLEPIRSIFLQPDVTDDYAIDWKPPDIDGILQYLCEEREFARDRVTAALERAWK
jgi:flap endonuclease-1